MNWERIRPKNLSLARSPSNALRCRLLKAQGAQRRDQFMATGSKPRIPSFSLYILDFLCVSVSFVRGCCSFAVFL